MKAKKIILFYFFTSRLRKTKDRREGAKLKLDVILKISLVSVKMRLKAKAMQVLIANLQGDEMEAIKFLVII